MRKHWCNSGSITTSTTAPGIFCGHGVMFGRHLEEDLKKFTHDFKGPVNEEVAKINKAVVEMVNIFNLSKDEGDIEDLTEVFPEELTNELLELESREKETTREEKKNPHENSQ